MYDLAYLKQMSRVMKKNKIFSDDNICMNCLTKMSIINDTMTCTGCCAERYIPQTSFIPYDNESCVFKRSSVFNKLEHISNIYYIHYNEKLCPFLVNETRVIYDKIQDAGYIKRGNNKVNILLHIIYCLCFKYDKICDKNVLKKITNRTYNPIIANDFLMIMVDKNIISYKDIFTTELKSQTDINDVHIMLIKKLIQLHINELEINADQINKIVDDINKLHIKNTHVMNFMLKTKLITYLHVVTGISIDQLCDIYSIKKYTIYKCKKTIII